jgi:hypothetical protein
MPFFTQTALIERYAHSSDPESDPELLEVVIDALSRKQDLYTYFFRNGPDPAWARVLLKHGFFSTPPAPKKTARGDIFPFWGAQEFLVAVAKSVPDVVIEHVKTIRGHAVYLEKAVMALRGIPLEMAETVLPIILGWLEDPQISYQVALEAFGLMTQFARDKKKKPAFTLFRALTAPLPAPNTKTYGEIRLGGAAVSIIPIDDYHLNEVREGITALQELDIKQTASILEDQLCAALKTEAETVSDTEYKVRSFWRRAIEDTVQDMVSDYKDVLLGALRDTLERWAQEESGTITPLVERYLADEHEILRRIAFHLLGRFPAMFRNLVAHELLRADNLDDVGIHHEYFELLEHGYTVLNRPEQKQLLESILAGPSQEKLESVADWVQKEREADREKYVSQYTKGWIRDRLWMLKNHLKGRAKKALDALVMELKEPDHPAFTNWSTGVYTVSEISPVTREEIASKTPESLLTYLKGWQPSKESQFGPRRESYYALGRDIASVILSNLEKYGELILKIALIRPEYATTLLHTNAEPALAPSLLWALRLNLCEKLLSDEQIRKGMDKAADRGWLNFRRATVSMLEKALTEDSPDLDQQLLPRIRDLLIILVDDPDPDLEDDRPHEGWFGHEDPLSVAINHIRSQALYSLIHYSKVFALHNGVQPEGGFGPDRLEPLITEVLTRKVDRHNDSSLAVHSVFGRELNLLYWLNQSWVETHVDDIFPPGDDEESRSFYVAAWDSYVVSDSTVYREIFSFLRQKYERAIENVSKGYITKTHLNPVKWLANHLLLEYLGADYDIFSPEGQESLIAKFFINTSPQARGEAAWVLGDMCRQNQDKVEEYWPRARALWKWRVNVASGANYSTDFNQEMRSFGHLVQAAPPAETVISLWPLLEGMLPFIGRSEDRDYIWSSFQNYLAKEVSRDPVRTIQFYRLMHDQLGKARWYYEKEARQILEKAAAEKASRQDALLLIDRIIRWGNYSFKDIQDHYIN